MELKIWHGSKRFSENLDQLADYMESRAQNEVLLLTFCFLKDHEKRSEDYTREVSDIDGKKIYSFVV